MATSDDKNLIDLGLRRVDALLSEQIQLESPGFEEKLKEAGRRLPEDIAESLTTLENLRQRLLKNHSGSPEPVADFIFQCGRAYERLDAFRQNRIASEALAVSPDGIAPEPLEQQQIDAIERLIQARDRIFRKVADFTLKSLLVLFGLFVAAFLIGLV
ncbi:hypothetical protein ACWJKU_06540 [Methylocaldum sp. MU1018]